MKCRISSDGRRAPHKRYFLIRAALPLIQYKISASNVWFGGIETFWPQKIIQKKWTKFMKILNYIKLSWVIFCTKLFQYPRYINHSQKDWTHFGLDLSKHLDLELSKHFRPKKRTRKINKIRKDFELCQFFKYNFLC